MSFIAGYLLGLEDGGGTAGTLLDNVKAFPKLGSAMLDDEWELELCQPPKDDVFYTSYMRREAFCYGEDGKINLGEERKNIRFVLRALRNGKFEFAMTKSNDIYASAKLFDFNSNIAEICYSYGGNLSFYIENEALRFIYTLLLNGYDDSHIYENTAMKCGSTFPITPNIAIKAYIEEYFINFSQSGILTEKKYDDFLETYGAFRVALEKVYAEDK